VARGAEVENGVVKYDRVRYRSCKIISHFYDFYYKNAFGEGIESLTGSEN